MKPVHLRLCLACVLLAGPLPAAAFTGGGVSGDPVWAGVGAFSGGGCCTGALIGPNLVITAAHVVSQSPTTFSFTHAGETYSLPVAAVHTHPDHGQGGGGVPNDAIRQFYDDLAVVELAQSVPAGVPTYALYEGELSSADHPTLTLVGRGSATHTLARNRLDIFYSSDQEPGQPAGAQPEILAYDYDGDGKDYFGFLAGIASGTETLEGVVGGGDSGSPIFIDDGGVWKLVGVSTFTGWDTSYGVTAANQFGAFGGGTYLRPYADWIQGYVAQVPEPRTWAMLLAGVGLIGVVARRRRV